MATAYLDMLLFELRSRSMLYRHLVLVETIMSQDFDHRPASTSRPSLHSDDTPCAIIRHESLTIDGKLKTKLVDNAILMLRYARYISMEVNGVNSSRCLQFRGGVSQEHTKVDVTP